jgi:N-methylhydantoinase B
VTISKSDRVRALDPITYEVVKHRLWQINDEQGTTIRNLSTSPIVVEGNDFNVGLFTAEGDLAVAGPYVLSHVTTMDAVIKNVIARVGDDVADGDMYLVNDPCLGALHQNDAAVVSPIFFDGQHVLWVGNVVHHADLAGIDEGSFCINAKDIFQEAPRYFLKLVERGVLQKDVEYTFVNNSRLPESVALDLRAQIGAINVAQDRLHDLLSEHGPATITAATERSVDDSERRLRHLLRAIPDGAWEADAYMDGDKVGSDRILRVHVELRKLGDELTFDFEGSDPQSEGPANATMYACYAGATTPVYALLCGGDIDWNSSIRRCVTVTAPEGTVVNARYPAAVSLCSIGFTWLAATAAWKAVAEMLLGSPDYRDRACPSWGVSCNANNLFAVDDVGRLRGALLSDHRGGGGGAKPDSDGLDHVGVSFSALSFMSNVEGQELKLPIRYLFRQRLPDSGGPGRYRGGQTVVSAMTSTGASQVTWKSQNTAGADQSNASGIAGGYPGAGSQVVVIRDAAERFRREPEASLASLAGASGNVEHQRTKSEGAFGPGDVFLFHAAGGGGFGDPLMRDVEQVAADVATGCVSIGAAREHYGVRIRGSGAVDLETTASERSERALARLGLSGGGERDLLDHECPECGGMDPERRLGAVVISSQELRAAGPWIGIRWAGRSPNFELQITACALCAGLRNVREVRKATV